MSDTEDLLRAKFDELSAARAIILEQSGPLREQRDKIKNEALAAAALIDDQIIAIEKDLPGIDTDLGRLTRALGGRQLSQSVNAA